MNVNGDPVCGKIFISIIGVVKKNLHAQIFLMKNSPSVHTLHLKLNSILQWIDIVALDYSNIIFHKFFL